LVLIIENQILQPGEDILYDGLDITKQEIYMGYCIEIKTLRKQKGIRLIRTLWLDVHYVIRCK